MQQIDWGEAFRIVGGGVLAVFVIMAILATMTHFVGKAFIAIEKKKKAVAKAAEKEAAAKSEEAAS